MWALGFIEQEEAAERGKSTHGRYQRKAILHSKKHTAAVEHSGSLDFLKAQLVIAVGVI